MSRVWIIQSKEIAISVGRMKMDANFFGIANTDEQQMLSDSHVFVREVWQKGILDTKRIQRLYHIIFSGDVVVIPSYLNDETIYKVIEYSKDKNAFIVMCLYENYQFTNTIAEAIDLTVHYGQEQVPIFTKEIIVNSKQSIDKAIGTILMLYKNNLSDFDTELIEGAQNFDGIPWYDEIIYMRT